ncbi:MAG: AraC family transcriptional regulator [Dokdonia sp.]|jgi:AraC-like DNA-binding protein|nr:AraC family transcriptional regulator [Cytophagaceae bacterium]
MREIHITTMAGGDILEQLREPLQGTITKQWGESILEFEGDYGHGSIRSISFDWGISLIDYNVCFTEDLKIIFNIPKAKPIAFIFISDGHIAYTNAEIGCQQTLERYQNIIVSTKSQIDESYIFPKNIEVKVNFIYVTRKEYKKKKNNNLTYLDDDLIKAFSADDGQQHFNHLGNFSLKIADQITELQDSYDSGIIRSLSIEGQLNLILAQQLLEHHKHQKGENVFDSINKTDIKKIHDLSAHILENLSEPLTIATLTSISGLSAKKLQTGFQVLYSKSVNEYIRHLKLELSRDYIYNTEHSISEIVYKIGFKSRSYFSKIFAEKYGMLPMEYRNKQRR